MLIVYMELRKVSEDLIISDKEYREIQIITEDDELIVSINPLILSVLPCCSFPPEPGSLAVIQHLVQ